MEKKAGKSNGSVLSPNDFDTKHVPSWYSQWAWGQLVSCHLPKGMSWIPTQSRARNNHWERAVEALAYGTEDTTPQGLSSLSYSAGISNLSFSVFFLLFPLPGQLSPSRLVCSFSFYEWMFLSLTKTSLYTCTLSLNLFHLLENFVSA